MREKIFQFDNRGEYDIFRIWLESEGEIMAPNEYWTKKKRFLAWTENGWVSSKKVLYRREIVPYRLFHLSRN